MRGSLVMWAEEEEFMSTLCSFMPAVTVYSDELADSSEAGNTPQDIKIGNRSFSREVGSGMTRL